MSYTVDPAGLRGTTSSKGLLQGHVALALGRSEAGVPLPLHFNESRSFVGLVYAGHMIGFGWMAFAFLFYLFSPFFLIANTIFICQASFC